jgi:hypothetical protein
MLYPHAASSQLSPSVESLEQRMLLASFQGVSLQDEFDIFGTGPATSPCPDTMGAIGPNHFIETVKGAVAIFDKATGARLSIVTLDTFHSVNIDGTQYPRSASTDPHVLYDAHSGRFFAIALELGAVWGEDNGVMLSVSRTSDPTGAWDKYFLDLGVANTLTDYPTLGVDDNGVYLGAHMFPDAGSTYAKIVATPKAPLLAATPSLGPVFQFTNIMDMYASPQPAHNFDLVGASDRAWFVSSSNSTNANINYRTMTWSGGVPSLSATSVLTTPNYGNPINAPAMGSTTNVNVVDDRLNMAVIRNNRLWTARNVGVNAAGGATGSNRTGVEWLELNVSGPSATLVQSGRVYDPAASQPRFYYVPSVNVNAQGAMRVGYSGSKATEFIGAYWSGRAPGDAAGFTTAPQLIKAGEAAYTRLDGSGRNRWGDFSYTTIDPVDDVTIWTIQEYAENGPAGNVWGTWIISETPNGIWDGGGDGTSWTDPVNWSNNVLPGANDSVIINVPANPTITLSSGTQTVYNVKSSENLVISGGTLSVATESTFNGSLTLSGGTLTGLGNATLVNASNTWSAGTMTGSGATIIATGAVLNVTGAGTRSATRPVQVNGLVSVATGGNKLMMLSSLAVAGKLDLNDNDFILDYTGPSQLAAVQALINSARNGGDWLGNGITSSGARTNPSQNTTLGAMEATDYDSVYGSGALFNAVDPDSTAVLVKYTYYGDTDFNGSVDGDDYSRTDSGFNLGFSGWLNGDFDGNGLIDGDDYALIDLAFNSQGGVL